MSSKKILLIDNQFSQFKEIYKSLHEFEVYPSLKEYDHFTDAVRVFLSGRYYPPIMKAASKILQSYVDKKFDLYIVDFKLSGNDDGSNGIELATKLRALQGGNPTVPVLFLSGHPRGEESASRDFEHMEGLKEWVEKGYASNRILNKSYFTLHVETAIRRLLGETEDEKLFKRLDELLVDPNFLEARPALKVIKDSCDDFSSLSEPAKLFIRSLVPNKFTDSKLKEMSKGFIKNYKS